LDKKRLLRSRSLRGLASLALTAALLQDINGDGRDGVAWIPLHRAQPHRQGAHPLSRETRSNRALEKGLLPAPLAVHPKVTHTVKGSKRSVKIIVIYTSADMFLSLLSLSLSQRSAREGLLQR
jgi:hypothetical protein